MAESYGVTGGLGGRRGERREENELTITNVLHGK